MLRGPQLPVTVTEGACAFCSVTTPLLVGALSSFLFGLSLSVCVSGYTTPPLTRVRVFVRDRCRRCFCSWASFYIAVISFRLRIFFFAVCIFIE
jgi:hypothetical protein